jgi:hypothetical protein
VELAGGFDRISKSEIAVEPHQYACRNNDLSDRPAAPSRAQFPIAETVRKYPQPFVLSREGEISATSVQPTFIRRVNSNALSARAVTQRSEGIFSPQGNASLCPGGNQAIYPLAHALLPLRDDMESGSTLSSVASGAVMAGESVIAHPSNLVADDVRVSVDKK